MLARSRSNNKTQDVVLAGRGGGGSTACTGSGSYRWGHSFVQIGVWHMKACVFVKRLPVTSSAYVRQAEFCTVLPIIAEAWPLSQTKSVPYSVRRLLSLDCQVRLLVAQNGGVPGLFPKCSETSGIWF